MKKNLLLLLTSLFIGIFFTNNLKAQSPTFYTGNVNSPSNSFPFNMGTAGKSLQALVAPGELTGAYLGRITKVYFQGTASVAGSWTGLTINMGQTTATTLPSASIVTGLTNVYTASSVSATSGADGWLSFTLNTPFIYDPNQSLVIEVVVCSTTAGSFSVTNVTKTGFRRTWNVSGCPMAYSGQGAELFNFGVDMVPGTGSGPAQPPIANFYAPDTVWINSPATLINTSSYQSRVFWNFPNENPLQAGYYRQAGYIDTAKYYNNITYTFTSPGLKLVKLLAVNDLKRDSLRDSISKYIYVDTPSRAPRADFITFKRIMGITEEAQFVDLSSNGPTQWDWSIDPPCISCITDPSNGIANYFITGTGQPGQNVSSPRLAAFDPGQFKVCLRVWNLRGMDSICKSQYIKVVEGNYMCSGSGAFISSKTEGYLYGISGPYQTYARSSWPSNCPGFTIAPCADSITLYVERIKMWPSDSIEIFNGPDTSSPRITAIGASSTGQIPLTSAQSIIKGGSSISFRYKPGSVALPSSYDSASISIRWLATPAIYSKPISKIDISDTLYSNQLVSYKNKSTGTLMKYSWDTDGNGVYDSTTSNPTRTFLITVPTLKNICLVTYNCVGSDTSCKQVAFLPVNRPPIARFTADKFVGFNTDTFNMIDQTANGVAGWRWTFIPGSVQYLNGTTSTSQSPQVRLTSPVPYTVRLTTTNAFGVDSMTKVAFINVNAYQTPGTGTLFSTIADATMGIRRVRMAGIDSTFANATSPSFQYINNTTQVGTMYRGGKYAIVLDRPTSGTPLDYKAWIDKNYNANFETNELILNKINNGDAQLTDTIVVPANQAYGNTRMRVGLDLANSTQFNSVYSVIGMFKDFNVSIKQDYVKPVINFIANASGVLPIVVRTEINKTFVDPWVTATDNIEGNISNRVQTISTLDTANIGVYSIKYFVTDYSGNTSDTLYRTVIVELNSTGPVLVLTPPLVYTVEVGINPAEPGYTALDNNGNNINSNVITTSNLDINKVGNYTKIYSITDAFNFNKTAVRQIRVRDTTKPVWVKKFIGSTYKHQINTVFNPLAIINATDNYDKSLSVLFSSGVNPNIIGKYFVVYNVTDSSGNAAAALTIPVEVSDYIKPIITLIGSLTTEVEVLTNFSIPSVTATDNYCASNTLTIVRTPNTLRNDTLGIFPVKFVVTDCVGNSDSIVRFIKISKRNKPIITLLGADPMNLPRFCEFQEPGFTVKDNYYTNLNAQVKVDISSLRNDLPGVYPINYVVTDPSGNRSLTVTREVNVLEDVCNVGIHENKFETYFNIYPSPSKGLLNIDMKNEIEFTSMDIYNVTGQLVAKFENQLQSKNVFDLSNQSNGLYFVRINTAKGVFSRSFVINK
jgi:PKD repeat protein